MKASRRAFIKTTALAGSALVIGVRWDGDLFAVSKPAPSFAPNGWIRIEPSGKTFLTVGKSEMGQGVRTSLAMILADELDADWSQIELVQASPGPDFKRLGTGGSWSVGGSWAPLRAAGAAARAMLIAAAASRWGVDAASCRTSSGAVRHDASGRSLRYGELAADAAHVKVPEKPPLKPLDAMKIIGTARNRIDAPLIVTGKARYGIDAKVSGMLYASIERAPVRDAKVKRLDSEAAKRVHGVVDVIAVPSGVAVVARSTWAAMKGRKALVVEWSEGANAAFNSADHWKALHAAATGEGIIMRSEGKPPSDAQSIEATYEYPFYAHAAVEPVNCIAHVHDGRCELTIPTQAPNRVQDRVAEALGLKPEHVQVNVTLLGGGFGRRLNADFAVEAALLARQVGVPVQVLWTREDDMQHGHFQMASVHRLSGAVDESGRGVAWRHKKVSSPHNLSGPPTAEELKDPVAWAQDSAWGVYDVPYTFPFIDTAYVRVDVPVPIGPWRSVYAPSSVFARESFIDELAHAAKKDPLEFRLSLLNGEPFKIGELTIDRARLRRVLQLAGEKSGWGSPLPAGRARGIACNVYDGETHIAYVAEVSMPKSRNGLPLVVRRLVAAVDCGVVINPRGIAQQVESGVIWALSMLVGEITFANGRAEQTSFSDFPVLRMSDAPLIETHIVPSHGEQPFGIGEPTVPPVVPAVLNAFFTLTGKRVRRLPMRFDA